MKMNNIPFPVAGLSEAVLSNAAQGILKAHPEAGKFPNCAVIHFLNSKSKRFKLIFCFD